jgi:hypothetical protein
MRGLHAAAAIIAAIEGDELVGVGADPLGAARTRLPGLGRGPRLLRLELDRLLANLDGSGVEPRAVLLQRAKVKPKRR